MLDDQIKKETERLASLATTEPKKEHKKVGGLIEYYREPLAQRIVRALFENDLKTVATSVVNEVMVPKAKDILADMFISGRKPVMGTTQRRLPHTTAGTQKVPEEKRPMTITTGMATEPPW